jgi:cysteinylglycine-S-conjugate dipeptidase
MFKTLLLSTVLWCASAGWASSPPYSWDLSGCAAQLAGDGAQAAPLLKTAQSQQQQVIQGLMELMTIPSISNAPGQLGEMHRAADATLHFYKNVVGAPIVRKIQVGQSFPYVIAESRRREGLPTIVLYAHYDVMPANGEWSITEAFTPRLIDDRLYGRGAGDNKGGVYVIGAALKPFLDSGTELGFNFRVIIEGEEEIGSPNFALLTQQHPELFSDADIVLIPDGVNLVSEVPTITTSLRGTLRFDVKVTAGERAVHSGLFGNAFPDPRVALTRVTGQLFRDDGSLAIDSLYTGLIAPSRSELETLSRLSNRDSEFRRNAGMLENAQILSRGVFPIDAQLAREVSVGVVSIGAPESNSFSLPPTAIAHLAVRVPPGKDPQAVRKAILEYYRANTPWDLHVEVSEAPGATPPWHADAEHPALQLAGQALTRGFQTEPTLYMGAGGTIGLMLTLHRATGGAPQMLIGIDDPDTNLHGPDEQLHLRTFAGNRDGLIHLMLSLGQARRKN